MDMEQTISATLARVRFGELMRQVTESHEPIIVERDGKPHVVVLSVPEYERLIQGQQQQETWQELVAQAQTIIEAELEGRALPPPEEILRELREERDAQVMALH
jgi:prevent-host-death family protein